MCRHLEREHLPLCLDEGIGVIPWSPLGGGLLTGKVHKGKTLPEGTRAAVDSMNRERYLEERNLDIAEAVRELARSLAKTPSQVALVWVAQQPGITSPIFGVRTLAQLEDNLGAADLVLDGEALARLEAVSKLELAYPYDFHERVRGIMKEAGFVR